MSRESPGVRLDQWLWAARFFKTRALARSAIEGGKVRYQGHPGKPGRKVETGAEICVRRGFEEWTVRVTGLDHRRRSATEAAALYEETPESTVRRAEAAAQRRLARESATPPARRPERRDRGKIIRFQRLEKS